MIGQIRKLHPDEEIYSVNSETLAQLNAVLLKQFLENYQRDDIERTHLFNGRYENIYLNEKHIPELAELKNQASEFANQILDTDYIDMGYWFNYMPAAAVTTAHRHDDDDELLSAAYYISVPENSGDIILQTKNEPIRITPQAGSFIFFKPNMVHEVSENLSGQNRLSIGINFGQRDSES